jgi:hypothetical protein
MKNVNVHPALFAIFLVVLVALAGCASLPPEAGAAPQGRRVVFNVFLNTPPCFAYRGSNHSLLTCRGGYTETCLGNGCGRFGILQPRLERFRTYGPFGPIGVGQSEPDYSDCRTPGTAIRPDGSCYRR